MLIQSLRTEQSNERCGGWLRVEAELLDQTASRATLGTVYWGAALAWYTGSASLKGGGAVPG